MYFPFIHFWNESQSFVHSDFSLTILYKELKHKEKVEQHRKIFFQVA